MQLLQQFHNKITMKRSAFTMVELIFVIVIIGILASVGIPKLSGVSDNAKKTAEIATISAVSTAIETAHGEWAINEGVFKWGNNRSSSELNSLGYPSDLNANNLTFGALIKGDSKDFAKINTYTTADYNLSTFTGPASNASNGVKFSNSDIAGKPDKNDFWVYIPYITPPKTSCTHNASGQVFYVGDFLLIDVQNTETATYTFTCN